MSLDKERWQQVDEILNELLDLDEEHRLARLQELVDPATPLYQDVLQLLQSCSEQESPFDKNALAMVPTFFAHIPSQPNYDTNALVGLTVGAYMLDEEIGRGGMGVVYRAHRHKGDFEQTVAVKLLLNINVSVAERFRREQQVLASLKHPNITQLYDGGLSDSGQPFLVMEYIEGVSITDYCESHQLPLSKRLALLEQVLEALAFSHKNLIVHRDIKPSNIMVTHSGQVKLLDFSIAKLLDATLDLEQTATHLSLFTPSFSAPEQVLNQPITVATDIYQLGLLYFRLLTGYSPLNATVTSLHELVKVVCQQEITKPSQAVAKGGQALEVIGNRRDLSKLLSGDLDAIIHKMLRKVPGERYASIEALKADIYAYRNHRPVAARQAAFSYNARKYLLRNWRTIALVASAVVLLVGYALSMKQQNQRVSQALARAEMEQKKAEQVAGFLTQTFEAADPNNGGLKGTTAADLLEAARLKINEDLKDTPEIQATLLNIFGKIYFRQRDYEKANELLTNLLEHNSSANKMDAGLLAESQLRLAQQRIGLGQFASAEDILRQSLNNQEKTEKRNAKQNSLYGETMAFLGLTLYRQQHREEAYAAISTAINRLAALGKEGDRMRSFALNVLANDQYLHDDLDGAVNNMREALRLKVQQLGTEHTETSNTQLGLAQMLIDQDELAEAEELANSAAATIRSHLPEDHPYQMAAVSALAKIAFRRGKHKSVEKLIAGVAKRGGGSRDSQPHIYLQLLSIENLLSQSKFAEADQAIADFLSQNRSLPDTNISARIALLHGRLRLLSDRPKEAKLFFEQALQFTSQNSIEMQFAKRDLAAALIATGDALAAELLLKDIVTSLSKRYRKDHSQIQISCSMLKHSLTLLNKSTRFNPGAECLSLSLHAGVYLPNHLEPFLIKSETH